MNTASIRWRCASPGSDQPRTPRVKPAWSWISGRVDAIARRRELAVGSGLLLVLVPTLFSIFPKWATWPVLLRVAVVVGWFVCAWIVVRSTARQGEQVNKLVGVLLARRTKARQAAAARLIRVLLTSDTGYPDHCEFRLFLFDKQKGRLMPSFEPGQIEGSEGWAPDQGATGHAWSSDTRVVVTGQKVSDGTWGLTATQQERYKHLQAVAAYAIRDDLGRPIAVLSVSTEEDDGFVESDAALHAHIQLANAVGRVLLDVLRLTADE